MILYSTYWLALSYFTYFFAYGVFLPFWSVWLEGEGLSPESIGILLGAGLVARFIGSLLIAPRVKIPAHFINALRLLALLTLIFAVGFYFGNAWAWLMLVIIGFNLFFSPLVPLTDALAATWQKQIKMDYGRVRLWGSLAFVVGSALTGQLVAVWGHHAILVILTLSLLAMLLGMLLKPSVMPQGEKQASKQSSRSWGELLREQAVWRFLVCVTLLQGAHAGYYSFAAIYWQSAGYSAAAIGYLWALGVVAEVLIFATNQRFFRFWSVSGLLLLSACAGVLRWFLMGSSTDIAWLIVIQILHCGSFSLCHLAAMRFIAARQSMDVIRLQAIYSALAMGGSIAVMTVIAGFLFEQMQGKMFWIMAAVAFPALFLRPKTLATN